MPHAPRTEPSTPTPTSSSPDGWRGPGSGRSCPTGGSARDARVYEEPLPTTSWQVPLDVDPRLALDDQAVDENLRYLLDREKHFDNQYDVTQVRSELLCYAQEILRDSRADAFLLADVPHSALSYAIYAIGAPPGSPDPLLPEWARATSLRLLHAHR